MGEIKETSGHAARANHRDAASGTPTMDPGVPLVSVMTV